MSELTNVIITGEVTKLPPDYAELTDPQKPIPAQVTFFEKRITGAQMLGALAFSIGAFFVGLLAILFAIAELFSSTGGVQDNGSSFYIPLFFGLTCLVVTWMMIGSLRLRRDLLIRQQKGEPTRLGIFLTPGALFEANEFGYSIIPRAHFRGLKDTTVQYTMNAQDKSFRLPGELVAGDIATLKAAIEQWSTSRS